MRNGIGLGRATVTRVVETRIAMRTSLFADTPSDAWSDNADLLVPDFWERDVDRWRIAMQSWVIRVDGLTVVVDTGVGNDRDRPNMPPMHRLSTDFLGEFARAGIDPDDVDVVVNTHLHTDHVGWNTCAVDGAWVPTFRNARYVMPEPDYRHFASDGPGYTESVLNLFSDSVFPVADQMQLWSGELRLSESLTLRPAPGHTPGSSVLWLDAGRPAVFVGDLTHCPIQIPRPRDACSFDVDPVTAATTRTQVFTEAARDRAVVLPAHYPGHGGATIVARGDRFEVDDWLDLDRI